MWYTSYLFFSLITKTIKIFSKGHVWLVYHNFLLPHLGLNFIFVFEYIVVIARHVFSIIKYWIYFYRYFLLTAGHISAVHHAYNLGHLNFINPSMTTERHRIY